uniref:Gibberellin receptor GID1L3 n=1 Tax=Lygodium japonicum TaxID=13824 RepID=A0A0B6VNN0_LYGJA|nr:gibberellin receptor GID1L3 [Lygodium japonicum]
MGDQAIVPMRTYILMSKFRFVYMLLRRPDGTLDRRTDEYLDKKEPANATPRRGVATTDVCIEKASGLWARVFWPTEIYHEDDYLEAGAEEVEVDDDGAREAGGARGEEEQESEVEEEEEGGENGEKEEEKEKEEQEQEVEVEKEELEESAESKEQKAASGSGSGSTEVEDKEQRDKTPVVDALTKEKVEDEQYNELEEEGLRPLVVYFHGGSFVHSCANSRIYDTLCRNMARMCGVVILSLNFHRAPEYKCPVPYEDGLTCLRWINSRAGKLCLYPFQCRTKKVFLAGDTGGANIAHHVAAKAPLEGISLSGMVLIMPMFGGEQRTTHERRLDGKYFVSIQDRDWYWRAFLPEGANRDDPACNPLSQQAPSMSELDLPPSLVVVGGFDLLRDWQLRYISALERAGKDVELLYLEKVTMGFFLMPNSPFFFAFIAKVREFLKKSF